jgi:hypothetical protein
MAPDSQAGGNKSWRGEAADWPLRAGRFERRPSVKLSPIVSSCAREMSRLSRCGGGAMSPRRCRAPPKSPVSGRGSHSRIAKFAELAASQLFAFYRRRCRVHQNSKPVRQRAPRLAAGPALAPPCLPQASPKGGASPCRHRASSAAGVKADAPSGWGADKAGRAQLAAAERPAASAIILWGRLG